METVFLQRVFALGLSGGVGMISRMTTTPIPMPGPDAAAGVDAVARAFAAGIAAVHAPLMGQAVAAVEGQLGMLLETLTPGPALAALLAELDPTMLTPGEQVSFLLATERLTAWVGSVQSSGLVAFTGPAPTATQYSVDGRAQVLVDARRTEIAGHLLWSEGIARGRVATARALACDLPETRQALACGAISVARATVIAEGAGSLTSGVDTMLEHATDGVERVELVALRRDMLTAYEARVTPYATTHDTGRTRTHVNRSIARLDPAGWATRRQRAIRTQSNVTLRHLPDGLSELTAVMATEHAITCAQTIETRARQLQATERETPIGLHRTTALQQLLTNSASDQASVPVDLDDAAAKVNPRLQLNVTIDLPTLLALREGVGEIDGVGPIPATAVRALVAAGGAAIRWLTTNDSGDPTAASPGYRIPDALRALIISRDRTCAMPNCTTPAAACEIDHIHPYDAGGPTVASNLQPLCKRHHQAKTHSTPVRSSSTPLAGHPLEDLAPLHERLAGLRQQLDERTDLGLTDTRLQTAIADLDTQAVRRFDDTLDQQLAGALPLGRSEGAITVMLRHHLTRHHARTCNTNGNHESDNDSGSPRRSRAGSSSSRTGSIHTMRHCPHLTHATDTPPF